MIRDFKVEDMEALRLINANDQRNRNCPDFVNDDTYFIKKIVEVDEKILGIVAARVTTEICLYLNKDVSRITKARELQEAFGILRKEIRKFKVRDAHIFVVPENDNIWAEYLQRNFGFERVNGISLERWL